ncbi:hypothetical protein LEN26_017628 [Aphanomyces euteiches]|nr:hypothetical protein LEN26_017628 [Aphanomyces euteiches]KAH9107776.1 hypothetical protein AeMF1_016960 [Aphanomyces euteiches]KAH9183189.1 hypothetical protein AeNC1_014832 [Aphanomyces euteiches]
MLPRRHGRTDWFQVLFDFREREYDYADFQDLFEVVQKTTLRSKMNDKTYQVGTFECLSLEDLRDAGAATAVAGQSTLRHIAAGDVFLMHCDPDNKHALFQAASQFNCLEFVSPNRVPENGVTCYANDMTQGPACAIAAGPATVYRNYFAEVGGQIGQTRDNQINNLDTIEDLIDNETHNFFEVYNGYTDSTKGQLSPLNAMIEDEAMRAKLAKALKIGVHWDVEVPFVDRYTAADNSDQIVSQAFCSAISVGYSSAPASAWAPFAQLVLDASYEATLWAAVVNYHKTGCNKVFLTALGGGVFGNRSEWIVDAIAKSVRAVANCGLDIVLVHYRRVDPVMQDRVARALRGNRR